MTQMNKFTDRAVRASIAANLLCLNFGLMFGITPLHSQLYQLPTNHALLKTANAEAANWICSSLFLGVAIGALLLGPFVRGIGPKSVLYLGSLLQVTSWFTIHFSTDILHIYASRIFAGLAGGAAFVALPIFLIEISKNAKIAESRTISIELWRSSGVLAGFFMAQYLLYDLVALIGIAVSLFSTLVLPFIQESPMHYLRKGNEMCMEKSLRWYRNVSSDDEKKPVEFLREVAEFQCELQMSKPIVTSSVPLSYKMKVGFYCTILMLGVHLTGVYFMLNYALQLYSPNFIAFVFAGVQLLGATLATMVAVKMRKKILIASSGIISGIILIALAFAGEWTFISTQTAATVGIILVGLYILFVSFGLQPISIVVVLDLLPVKFRACYLSVIYAISGLILFGLSHSYFYLSIIFDANMYFLIFAAASFCVALMALFILPDTENKSMEEVNEDMGFVVVESVAHISTISNGYIHEQTYL